MHEEGWERRGLGCLTLCISLLEGRSQKERKCYWANFTNFHWYFKITFCFVLYMFIKATAARTGLLCEETANWVILQNIGRDPLKGSIRNRGNSNRLEIGTVFKTFGRLLLLGSCWWVNIPTWCKDFWASAAQSNGNRLSCHLSLWQIALVKISCHCWADKCVFWCCDWEQAS